MLKCPPTQLSREFQKPPFPVLRPSKAGKLGVFKSRKFIPIQEQLCLPNSPPSHYLSLSGQDLMEIQTAGNISVVSFSLSQHSVSGGQHTSQRAPTHTCKHTQHTYTAHPFSTNTRATPRNPAAWSQQTYSPVLYIKSLPRNRFPHAPTSG